MSIERRCNGCGESMPACAAGALSVQRDANPGQLSSPGLVALDRTDWCSRCAAPILAVLSESLVRARQARERRAIQQQALSVSTHPDLSAKEAVKNLRRKRHLRLTT